MATKKVTEAEEKDIDINEEYVEITLFRDGEKYKDDVFVCVNGESCLIKRGEPVKVKRKFAELLKLSHDAEIKTNESMAEQSAEFLKKQDALSE